MLALTTHTLSPSAKSFESSAFAFGLIRQALSSAKRRHSASNVSAFIPRKNHAKMRCLAR